jgi:hypothetical protein
MLGAVSPNIHKAWLHATIGTGDQSGVALQPLVESAAPGLAFTKRLLARPVCLSGMHIMCTVCIAVTEALAVFRVDLLLVCWHLTQ